MTSASAPIIERRCGANVKPSTPITVATTRPSATAWKAVRAAPSGSFSPIRLATNAVTPILSPSATVYMMVSMDSVSPTVATAAGPNRATKNTSTTANTDSMAVSRTIGTASSRTARPMGPDVKSWSVPRTASFNAGQRRKGASVTPTSPGNYRSST